MLNTQKLLYVLPDLAYIAELLPDKKPYSFAIQSFKQVNGEFLNETEFIPENIVKLINKLEEGEEYFLVLPDFLFTNTIVSVQETSDSKIKEKLTTETLPKLGLKDDTHLVETVVLNQFKGTTRVQLSAIEKSVLSVFKVAIAEKDIKIAGIAPLSWTIKSLVSLEPSISVLQLGTKLYTAQHYIGVDQTTTANIDQPDNIIETIKTLKGAEPSIQTVYLSSNLIIEEKLKDSLNKILPIQQMSSKDANEKIPSYVSQIIVATQRTLAIPDFSVPTFKLGKPTSEEKDQYAAILTATGVVTDEDDDEVHSEIPKPQISPIPQEEEKADEPEPEIEVTDNETIKDEEEALTNSLNAENEVSGETSDSETTSILPSASAIAGGAAVATAASSVSGMAATPSSTVTPTDLPSLNSESLTQVPDIASATTVDPTENKPVVEDVPEPQINTSEVKTESTQSQKPKVSTEPSTQSDTPPVVIGASKIDAPIITPSADIITPPDNEDDAVLKQFAQNGETAVESTSTSKPIIKNKSGNKNMMKMILITTGVFILTVAIGIGVGLAILKYSGNNDPSPPPVVEVEQPTPTPESTPSPTPEASPSASVDTSSAILVVNATTKAGYAGQIQTKIKAAEFTSVDTGNAKGDYDDGENYIYMKDQNSAFLSALEEATGLKFTATDSAKVEDAPGKYDAVVVLGE